MSPFSDKDLRCLATNVYHEARGESVAGMLYVAKVTINRALKYNKSICSVVYAPYQFSWTLKRQPKIKTLDFYLELSKHAHTVNLNAYYFHAKYVKPYWAKHKTFIKQEGNHLFYA